MRIRSLLVAALAAAIAPAGASAAQTARLSTQCKFPLVGAKSIFPVVVSQLPERVETGESTAPFGITATIPGYELAPTVVPSVKQAGTLEGTITLSGRVRTGTTLRPFADISLALPATRVGDPETPPPGDFVATGTGPALTFPEAGVSRVEVTGFAINLKVRQADGAVIELPKISKDLDGLPIVDSDGDPETYDAACKLDAAAVTELATVIVGPAPSVMPTPTPLPSVTPHPTPPPTPTPMRAYLPGSTLSAYTCKWPLAGETRARVASHVTDPSAAGDAVEYELWYSNDGREAFGSAIPDLTAYDGQLGATLGAITPRGVVPIDVPAPIDTYAFSTLAPFSSLMLHAIGTVPKSELPAGTTGLMLITIRPSIRLVDSSGATISIPQLSTAYDGVPVPDDGNPYTFGVPCHPEIAQGTLDYVLQGTTSVSTIAKGVMPVTGHVSMSITAATGAVVADLRLNDTQGRLTAAGFLPVTATIGFASAGPSTGMLLGSRLSLTNKLRIKVKAAKLFGVVPIIAGNTCQTKNFSDLTLASTEAFDLGERGGRLAGTFAISALNGCGALNGLVAPNAAGSGNTMQVSLTPAVHP